MYYVYQITCVENERFLVGVTKDFRGLKRDTLYRLKEYDVTRVNIFLLEDFIRWGRGSLVFENLGEFEEWEEAHVMAWWMTLEERVVREEDVPNDWKVSEKAYNRVGIRLGELSEKGKELVTDLTGMVVEENGSVILDVVPRGRKKYIYGGKAKYVEPKDRIVRQWYSRKRYGP